MIGSPQHQVSRLSVAMTSSYPPSECETGGRSRQDERNNGNSDIHNEDMPPLTKDSQLGSMSENAVDCVSLENELHDPSRSSPLSDRSYLREDSIKLSDGGVEFSDSKADGNGDTVKDVMNTPCTTVVPLPVQDFSSLYLSDELMSDEAEQTRQHRRLMEGKLREQLIAQESEFRITTLDDMFEMDPPQHGYRNDGDGVDDTGIMHGFDGVGLLPKIQDAEEPTHNLCRTAGVLLDGTECLMSSMSIAGRASASSLTRSLSSIELTPDLWTAVQAPCGLSSRTTPSTSSTRSSRRSELKMTSPSKRRRKASSPQELAEIFSKAAIEDLEAEERTALEELEKYRDMDLAPLEPIMESSTAGDLITHGTPVKAKDSEIFQCKHRTPEFKKHQPTSSQKPQMVVRTQLQTPPRSPTRPTEQDDQEDTEIETRNAALIVNPDAPQTLSCPYRPPFITVIEILPSAIFWCTAAAIVRCSMDAFDALVERLTGLSVGDVKSWTD